MRGFTKNHIDKEKCAFAKGKCKNCDKKKKKISYENLQRRQLYFGPQILPFLYYYGNSGLKIRAPFKIFVSKNAVSWWLIKARSNDKIIQK